MKNLFKIENIKAFVFVLAFVLVVKLLWFVVQVLWLSPVDIDQEKDQPSKTLYYKVKLTPRDVPAPITQVKKVITKVQGSIKELTLLGIYNDEETSIAMILYKKNSKVLGIGEDVNGFILEGTGKNYAIFSKNNENYKVMLVKKGKSTSSLDIKSETVEEEKPKSEKTFG
ncbi:MAG: hypothetical protein Q9M36_15835 [Sulfurovum sp.]|nr:hypothetical protein [Sulfurovum sp.]